MKKSTLVQLGLIILSTSACDIEDEDAGFYEEGRGLPERIPENVQHLTHANAHNLLERGKVYPIYIYARHGECELQWNRIKDELTGERNAKWGCDPEFSNLIGRIPLYLHVFHVTDTPDGRDWGVPPLRVEGAITMNIDGIGALIPRRDIENLEKNATFFGSGVHTFDDLLLFDESINGMHEDPKIVNQIGTEAFIGGEHETRECNLQWNGGNPVMGEGQPERNAKWDCDPSSPPDQLEFWVGPAAATTPLWR